MENTLQVGFGRADITPQKGVFLAGFGNQDKRPMTEVIDPLYATCLAFTDSDGRTALVYTVDLCSAPNWVRPFIAEAVDLPVEKIHISGTHTHAGPVASWNDIWVGKKYEAETKDYLENKLKPAAIQAAKDALADRKPAEIYITTTYTERMNFVRRYLTPEGKQVAYGFKNHKVLLHESEADNEMQLVKFVREGGKDVVLCNFQAHQTMTGRMNEGKISADGCGAMRAAMEERTGCLFAYFTGACGNVVPGSRIEGERRFTNEQYVEYGQTLADYAIAAADGYRPVRAGKVLTRHVHLDVETNHSMDHLADQLRPIAQLWRETGDRIRCDELAHAMGLNNVFAATSALNRLKMDKTKAIDLDEVAIGDIVFAIVPAEYFDTNGMEIKKGSPFKMTVIATLANECRGYIPSALGFKHGGYCIDSCIFVPGAAELMSKAYVEMACELHKEEI